MAMTALLASLLAMANLFDPLRGREGSIVLYVSPPTCVMIYQRDEFTHYETYIGELHELTILANVTPACQS